MKKQILSERSIKIKELISDEVGMDTLRFVELQLIENDKQINELRSLLKEYNFVTISTICSFDKGTIGYNDLDQIRKKVKNVLNK